MTARLALALLFIVPAALAYPWRTVTERWVLGVAVGVVIVAFAWWRGQFATTKLARRLAIWRGNRGVARPDPTDRVTVLLKLDPAGQAELPVELIAGYADRYGLRADKVRITSRDQDGARQSWVSLTLGAAGNLSALQARSAQIPLRDTAEVTGRRLADHLREAGWHVTVIDDDNRPVPVADGATETWRAIADDAGFLAAYRIPVASLQDGLTDVWSLPSAETWTAVEFAPGTATAVCALRTAERPDAAAPSLVALGGYQRATLDALDPLSVHRLDGHTPVDPDLTAELRWPATLAATV